MDFFVYHDNILVILAKSIKGYLFYHDQLRGAEPNHLASFFHPKPYLVTKFALPPLEGVSFHFWPEMEIQTIINHACIFLPHFEDPFFVFKDVFKKNSDLMYG